MTKDYYSIAETKKNMSLKNFQFKTIVKLRLKENLKVLVHSLNTTI